MTASAIHSPCGVHTPSCIINTHLPFLKEANLCSSVWAAVCFRAVWLQPQTSTVGPDWAKPIKRDPGVLPETGLETAMCGVDLLESRMGEFLCT